MTIEEALARCMEGEFRIEVNSEEEKRQLIELAHQFGYGTGGCRPQSYKEYPYMKKSRGLEHSFDFTLRPISGRCVDAILFSSLVDLTQLSISDSVSDLL